MKEEVLKINYPRFYLVATNKGIKIRCNQDHLLKTREKVLINSDIDYENIILLEDIPSIHDWHSERLQTDSGLEAQQPHRRGMMTCLPLRWR